MDIKQLRYFFTVVQSGSLSAASRALNITQSALSYHLRHIEEELGMTVLERHARGIAPNEAGKTLFRHAEVILARLNRMETDLAQLRYAKAHILAFGMTPSVGRVLGPALIGQRDEALHLRLQEGMTADLTSDLHTGNLDAAICFETEELGDLARISLYNEMLFLVGPPEVVGSNQNDIDFLNLKSFPLILDGKHQLTRKMIESVARKHDVSLPLVCDLDPNQMKREMVVHHGYCSVVPFGYFSSEINAGLLVARRIVKPEFPMNVVLVFSDSLSSKTRTTLGHQIKILIRSRMEDRLSLSLR